MEGRRERKIERKKHKTTTGNLSMLGNYFPTVVHREDNLAEIAAEAGLSVETRTGEGEGPLTNNGPSGGEGGAPPGHGTAGGKKKISAM